MRNRQASRCVINRIEGLASSRRQMSFEDRRGRLGHEVMHVIVAPLRQRVGQPRVLGDECAKRSFDGGGEFVFEFVELSAAKFHDAIPVVIQSYATHSIVSPCAGAV